MQTCNKADSSANQQGCNVVFVISDLGSGGAQRVVTTIANNWAISGKNITLITFAGEERDFFVLNNQVRRISLGIYGPSRTLKDAIYANVSRLRALRRTVKSISPDVVMSFIGITNILVIISLAWLRIKVIISERSDPAIEHLGWPWQFLRFALYRFADIVTANSHGAINTMYRFVPNRKLRYLPNPIITDKGNVCCGKTNREKLILGVGRLGYEKGYDILLKAFAAVHDKIPDWKLVIVGDGALAEDLRKQAENLDIKDRVIWAGRINDPLTYYQKAAIFVLPSRREGMPNVLLEAIVCKLPVIVTNSSPGPLEIVQNNHTGLVVASEDYEALSQALVLLAEDESLRMTLGNNAAEKISEYHLEKVLPVWESVIGV